MVAILAWLLLPRGPGSAWFLTPEERDFATERMRRDTALFIQHEYGKDGLEKDRLSKRDVMEALKDWKFYGVIFFNICASVPTQAFSIFLPLVLKGLGFESIHANLVSRRSLCSMVSIALADSFCTDDCAALRLRCRGLISFRFEL